MKKKDDLPRRGEKIQIGIRNNSVCIDLLEDDTKEILVTLEFESEQAISLGLVLVEKGEILRNLN